MLPASEPKRGTGPRPTRRPRAAEPKQPSQEAAKPIILIVEDKPSVRALVLRLLAAFDCIVLTAGSLEEALAIAAAARPHLIILDLHLPDASDLEALEAIRARQFPGHVVVMSGFLTTTITVGAMKLGALHVFEKPLEVEPFLRVVRAALDTAVPGSTSRPTRVDGSAAARVVKFILMGLEADEDLKTLGAWADCSAVSLSTLAETCHLALIKAHDARDFLRMLSALIRARRAGCPPEALLDVADHRTLEGLIERAGLTGRTATATIAGFLDGQKFIPSGNEALRLLRKALGRPESV